MQTALLDLPPASPDFNLALVVVLMALGWWIYKSCQRQTADRRKALDRLVKENREYHEWFLRILDRHSGTGPDDNRAS